jgi:hypothetical protein
MARTASRTRQAVANAQNRELCSQREQSPRLAYLIWCRDVAAATPDGLAIGPERHLRRHGTYSNIAKSEPPQLGQQQCSSQDISAPDSGLCWLIFQSHMVLRISRVPSSAWKTTPLTKVNLRVQQLRLAVGTSPAIASASPPSGEGSSIPSRTSQERFASFTLRGQRWASRTQTDLFEQTVRP